MVLSAEEESLITVLRGLPPQETAQVVNWAHQLTDLAWGRSVEWSDTWSDEDLADASSAAVQRFEGQELENR